MDKQAVVCVGWSVCSRSWSSTSVVANALVILHFDIVIELFQTMVILLSNLTGLNEVSSFKHNP